MDLYKELKLKPVRPEPSVWVSRLVIYRSIAPKPHVIRDIGLTRGVNIIWAEEAEDDNPATEITGHSAGKTTFCRLLRYVLGEKTFGTGTTMDLIHDAFPGGYVAAEIHVEGKRWAVRRPFGGGRMSYVLEDVTIEQLLDQRGRSVSQEAYVHEIGLESLLDRLETGGIVQTGEAIQWEHILGWCTRDQETRFQNIHDWRSPRSESGAAEFRFPKAGPLFVMRAVLGLFLPDELKGEEKLAGLQREKDNLIREIDEKRREPQFRVNLYDHQLREHLKAFLPDEQNIDTLRFRSDELAPDLERLTARAVSQAEATIAELRQSQETIQQEIDDCGARIRQQQDDLGQFEALFGLDTAAGGELDAGLSQRQEQRRRLEEHKDKTCPFGAVVIHECTHVQNRQRLLRVAQIQDAHAMEQAEATRDEERKRVEEERGQLQKSIEELKSTLQESTLKRDTVLVDIRKKRDQLHDLVNVRDELEVWMKKKDEPGVYAELDRLRQRLDDAEGEITKTEESLSVLLREHDQNRELLASIFSCAVRAVLPSGTYDGTVSLDNRELAFHITHGPAMTGEAVETLSVLLADMGCLVYNSISDKAHLPGFLIHDSPREADLGLRIYRSFLRLGATLQQHFDAPDACPFQYVLTTTTPPPEELRTDQYVKLRLDASHTDELLLRVNVAEASKNKAAELFTGKRPRQ